MESFMARLVERRLLSGNQSTKRVYHLAFAIDPRCVVYQPGDALAVFPKNSPSAIERVVTHIENGATIAQDLQQNYCLQHLTEKFCSELRQRLSPEACARRDQLGADLSLADLLEQFPEVHFTGTELLSLLKPLRPRLYSITSSQRAYPSQIQLIVAEVAYQNSLGKMTYGVASHYLCETLNVGDEARVAVISSKFKLPEDDTTAVVMIGPGTGIAPFRSFLQERAARHSHGSHWLFFGDQHRREHFYYQQELEAWQKKGVLTRLDLAFSRDQDYKIYVQDCMREHAAELWHWIDEGAYIYICGDAARMAVDVETRLLKIFQEQGKITAPEEYLKQLKQIGRYQRDVY
ncbi:MAG: hypothetical protein LW808_002660 [Verrucomicrobiota bacterium]|nr:MAG: hypothetical protein LW808_002660 [Verrucomicrobiota bacterium]